VTERHTDPAFPFIVPRGDYHCELGISRREYFAAMAMQGLLTDYTSLVTESQVACLAVKCADSLIRALAEVKP
jgi:hypothetical protein